MGPGIVRDRALDDAAQSGMHVVVKGWEMARQMARRDSEEQVVDFAYAQTAAKDVKLCLRVLEE